MPEPTYNADLLFAEGDRLPFIKEWLCDTAWSRARYAQLPPEDYLRSGEAAVCRLEELISTGAQQIWDELQADSQNAPTIRSWLGLDAPLPSPTHRAAIVLDGLSLRELPLLLQMAQSSGLAVKAARVVATSLPTETMDFVEQRVIGSRLGPSQLPGRAELATQNTKAFYLDQPNTRAPFPEASNLLIWSTYPDRLFFNDEARTEALFSTFHRDFIPTIWQCTAQAIPRGVPTVITSDHGYIFFGASHEATRSSSAMEILGQSRSKQFAPEEIMPAWHSDLQLLPGTRTAMLRGRLRARASGTSSRKLYQHGGFSLMEVLVPWIELEPR